ncbi:chromosome transmission fidelity protein 8 homolog isoform 2 [Striga asiatica]|uniref:Chromosome transmission fidelity protein 8 homolog isoform 2 n=1 Tax=Striga asiatica TaxID=4170 RepID=A0A5A7PKE2_STRAF|nr:chromosome transmission fidelity protein 8 homolog isoform 2 [Striga asiatica]
MGKESTLSSPVSISLLCTQLLYFTSHPDKNQPVYSLPSACSHPCSNPAPSTPALAFPTQASGPQPSSGPPQPSGAQRPEPRPQPSAHAPPAPSFGPPSRPVAWASRPGPNGGSHPSQLSGLSAASRSRPLHVGFLLTVAGYLGTGARVLLPGPLGGPGERAHGAGPRGNPPGKCPGGGASDDFSRPSYDMGMHENRVKSLLRKMATRPSQFSMAQHSKIENQANFATQRFATRDGEENDKNESDRPFDRFKLWAKF